MSKSRIDLLQELADLQDLEESGDDEIVLPPVPEHEPPPKIEPVLAQKKPRSEKQIAVFQKALETKRANHAARKDVRETAEAAERAVLEEKMIKKAIAIKKKQLKARALIDNLPEDSGPVLKTKVETIRESVPAEPPKPPKPAVHFF